MDLTQDVMDAIATLQATAPLAGRKNLFGPKTPVPTTPSRGTSTSRSASRSRGSVSRCRSR
jgi:hypothetical protein